MKRAVLVAVVRVMSCVLAVTAGCGKGDAAGTGAGAASGGPTAIPSAPVAASSAPPAAPPPAASVETAPETVIAQHILVAYASAKRAPRGVTRSKADARARAAEALAKVRAGAPFEDVVKQYSDDAGSVDRMGSVGKFHRGDMDPAFGAAAFALKPGGVSDLVETPFGFHIIKRTQ